MDTYGMEIISEMSLFQGENKVGTQSSVLIKQGVLVDKSVCVYINECVTHDH